MMTSCVPPAKNSPLPFETSARLSMRKSSTGFQGFLGVPGEVVMHHFAHLHLPLLLHHLVPSPHLIRAVVSGCPSFLIFFSLPLLALCAVRAPIVEDLLNSDLRARLARVLSQHLSITDLTIQPMRRRPGSRHVFSYKLVVGDEQTGKESVIELIGKRDTTRAIGKAAKEYEAMRLLWDAGFGQDRSLRIPRPLHHFDDLKLIVQEKARGTKLRTFLGVESDASVDHARMTGVWLAKLHNLPVSPAPVCSYEGEKTSLRMFVAAVSASQPQLAPELQHYAAQMETCFDGFQNVPATYVHGDFHPDHIYVANDLVTVIDFERFCVGDPARDLGSFIAHMRTTACFTGKSLDAANQQIAAFLKSYFSSVAMAPDIAIAPRIAPFVGLSTIEAVYYVASVLNVTHPSTIAMYMRCLQQAGLPPMTAAAPRAAKKAAAAQGNGSSGATL